MANTKDIIGEQATLDGLINHTLTEFEDDDVKELRDYAFYKNPTIKNITLPSIKSLGTCVFRDCIGLENVYIDKVEAIIGSDTFRDCYKLKSISFPLNKQIGGYCFYGCHSLNDVDFTNIESVGGNFIYNSGIGEFIAPNILYLDPGSFGYARRLSVVDIGQNYSIQIPSSCFNNCHSLCHLVMRNTDKVLTMTSTNALSSSSIGSGIGWIYVPTNLVNSYKTAGNWSSYASQIVSIDEYPKKLQDETITDSWEDIITSARNGTHSKYNVGDIKYCNIGGAYVPMQIIALNTDLLTSGGNAAITFISRGSIDLSRMNSTASTIGGWAECELRAFLQGSIYPQIESTVRNAIKTVTKTSASNGELISTEDKVWIPSVREIFSSGYGESQGCSYTTYFNGTTPRKRYHGLTNTATQYWMRTVYSSTNFRTVTSSGSLSSQSASSDSMGVVIGFCI